MDRQNRIRRNRMKRSRGNRIIERAKTQPAAQVPGSPRREEPTETDVSSDGQLPRISGSSTLPSPSNFTPSSLAEAEAAVPLEWLPLDQYYVRRELNKGAQGVVHLVHHQGWNIDMVVKSPRPEFLAKAGGKERFIREAETWAKLDLYPHIVSCYYVRTLGGLPRVFTEYVAGGDLSNWIRSRRLYMGGHKQAIERMLDMAIQFAWGLQYAHDQSFIHRDVKPSNVMITSDGIVKVTDFGQGMTLLYRSPEQAEKSAKSALSHKTDIWSWAVSVLEMFVGSVAIPWVEGPRAGEWLVTHKQAVAQDGTVPAMPSSVASLLEKCFQQQPEKRPATMLDVATELQAIYVRLLEKPYLRQTPKPAEMLADSRNNRALSLFDLGRIEEAKQVWQQALQVDPQHLETTYNRGVILWRRGELTDDVLVKQLEVILTAQGQRWQTAYLLAQVHLERGDADAALPLLEKAARQAPGERDVQRLLERAQAGTMVTGRCLRTLQGHTGWVHSVSLSADGRLALSGSFDKTVRLWEVATGQCLRVFQGHTLDVSSVSLSADGRLALSGSFDKTVRLWEVTTGRCLRVFQGQTDAVWSVSLSVDGRLALSGSDDGAVRLWEVATGQCLRIFEGVGSVSLSADGRLALSVSGDQTVRLWEVATGQCLRVFQGHTNAVKSVSLSADGRLALSGSSDQTVRLWEVATGRCLRVLQGHTDSVESVSLSADGRLALSGSGAPFTTSGDYTVRLWEVATGRCLRTFAGHTNEVESVSLSADGRLALSGSWDKTVRLWELPREHSFCPPQLSQLHSAADLSDVESQAADLLQQAQDAWEGARFTEALPLVRKLRALPGWERTSTSLQAWARLFPHCSKVSVRTAWLARTLQGHTNAVSSVSLSADGRLALSGSFDEMVRLWEVATGQCLRTFAGHTGWVNSVSLSADGRLALSGSRDKTVRLWEVATGQCLRVFQGHTEGVYSVSLSADGRLALSGSAAPFNRLADDNVRLWEVATGRCLRVFQGHTSEVYSVSLSADGRLALSGSIDRTVRLWEVATGQCLRTLQGHTDSVKSVSLSTDGRLALSGSRDKTVRLWEVATGRCLRVFEGHTNEVSSVSLSADGRLALSGGSWDKTVRLWELDWELEAHDPVDWDEGAWSTLETFLAVHTPYAGVLRPDRKPTEQDIQQALTRRGRPTWTEQDFQELIRQLQDVGYGWLRPEGVRHKLEERAASWQGPPPFTRGSTGKMAESEAASGLERRSIGFAAYSCGAWWGAVLGSKVQGSGHTLLGIAVHQDLRYGGAVVGAILGFFALTFLFARMSAATRPSAAVSTAFHLIFGIVFTALTASLLLEKDLTLGLLILGILVAMPLGAASFIAAARHT